MSIAMEPTFVGEDRRTRLRGLTRLYDEVSRTGRSRLVVLSAPTGWGKTRIVREFYAYLARAAAGGYWPASLDAGEGSWLEARKRVFPPPFDVPEDVEIPYLWLGVSCQRDQMGRELAALQYAERQFEAHVGPLAAALEGTSDRWKARLGAVGAIAGLFGLPDPVSLALTWQGVAASGWELVKGEWESVRGRRAGERARRVETHGGAGESERAVELATQLARLSGDDLPVVLVIDDAHWADPGTIAFVQKLLSGDAHVLIVATAWPDKLGVQEAEAGTFGHALGGWIRAGRAERHDLERLPGSSLESLVREAAPDVDPEVLVALRERADGNPNRLQGLMSLRVVRRALGSGAPLSEAQIAALPTGDAEIIQAIWRDLPEHVQEVLALSTVQGAEFNPQWIPAAAELLDLTDADTGLAEAQSPWGWVRALDAALAAFVETGLFERAREESRTLFLPDELTDARRAMLRWAADQKGRADWQTLSLAARRALLEAHYIGAADGLLEVDRQVIDTALELIEHLERGQELARCREVAERGIAWTEDVLRWADAWWSFRHRLADAIGGQGDIAGAIERYRALLADHADAFRRWDDPHLEVRYGLTWWLIVRGEPEAALRELDDLIRVWTERHGEEGEPTLRARRRRGMALARSGRTNEAIGAFERLLEQASQTRAPDDPDVLLLRVWHANTLGDARRIPEAIAELEEVVEAESARLGRDHPSTMGTRNDLGAWLLWRDPARAREVLEPLLADRLRVLGPDHPDTLTTRGNLAGAYAHTGEAERAIEGLRELLDDQRRLLGADHQATITTLSNLAFTLEEEGRLDEALAEMRILLRIREGELGDEHDRTLRTRRQVAELLVRTGDPVGALELLERLEEPMARVLGADSLPAFQTYETLARALGERGRLEEAARAWERLVALRVETVGPAAPGTCRARREVGATLLEIARADPTVEHVEAARDYIDRLADDALRDLGPHHAYTRAALELRQDALASLPPG